VKTNVLPTWIQQQLIAAVLAGWCALLVTDASFASPKAKESEPPKKDQAEQQAKVLPAENFFGKAQMGYQAAAEIPDLCAKIFCYCGCDLTDNHQSLLDCFTSTHGEGCDICIDEAIQALALKKQGLSTAEIQKKIDCGFEKQYPFEKPSPTLTKYRNTRYDAKKARLGDTSKTTAWTPKVKAGFKTGQCCGGHSTGAASN
jgi:hypothetical protein